MDNESRELSKGRVVGMLVLQLVLLCAGGVWATVRLRVMEQMNEPPIPRLQPVTVLPLHNDRQVVSDAELTRVLDRLKPSFRGPNPKINYVDHALRMWGTEAVFADADCLSGVEMRDLLLDHRQFAQAWSDSTEPLLRNSRRGTAVRTQEGLATSSHVDHTLATMAEIGTPLDYPVITVQGEVPLSSLLEYSLNSFSLNQVEYEWSSLVYALYLPDGNGWMTTEGQHVTFDRLADRLMRQRLTQGVCRGQHRLHTLVMLLRIDDQSQILSTEGRERVEAYLRNITDRLLQTQSDEGYWSGDWPGPEHDGISSAESAKLSPLTLRLLVTGHVLEWWALAPESLLPRRDRVHRASRWLIETIDELSPAQIRQNYTYLTHAGRALALWRGRFPHECL